MRPLDRADVTEVVTGWMLPPGFTVMAELHYDHDSTASGATMRWNVHNNDLGDRCPFSGEPVDSRELDEHGDDARCPQSCRGSYPVEVEG